MASSRAKNDGVDDWNTPPDKGMGPAYLAALGVVAVSFGLGLAGAGLMGRGPGSRVISLMGVGALAVGVTVLGIAAWMVGGPSPPD